MTKRRLSLPAWVRRTVVSLAKGHRVTLDQMLRRPITNLYPEEPVPHFPGFRSIPVLKANEETGKLNCTACGLCARSCPPQIIFVESVIGDDGRRKQWPAFFNLDLSRCMVCNLCVEACPFDALEMAADNELSAYDVRDLFFNMHELAALWKTSPAVRIAGGQKI